MTDHELSRRQVLNALGIGAVGAGVVGVGSLGIAGLSGAFSSGGDSSSEIIPFRGKHQAGITTPMQNQMYLVAFDIIDPDREKIVAMLKEWTELSEHMVQGYEAMPDGAAGLGDYAVPADTGDALDLPASNLTVTIGFGPGFFVKDGKDLLGVAKNRPKELNDLPHFPGDVLIQGLCGGDIAIQACADDPQVAVHAVRNLARVGIGIVETRWSQMGFGRASSTSREQVTPRNLFGFKDGTNNILGDDDDLLNKFVWFSEPQPSWFVGGTYLVGRRIRMTIENWDRQVLLEQEATFGRKKLSGAPLGAEEEFDELPLDLNFGVSGPVIPEDAHVRIASHQENRGIQMLRRSYNFADGSDGLGHINAGLFFIAFVSSVDKFFTPIQAQLAKKDKMNEYVRYESSSVFACPAGLKKGEYWGQRLFEG